MLHTFLDVAAYFALGYAVINLIARGIAAVRERLRLRHTLRNWEQRLKHDLRERGL